MRGLRAASFAVALLVASCGSDSEPQPLRTPAAPAGVSVELPASASAPVRLGDAQGRRLELALVRASPVPLVRQGGIGRYFQALPGVEWILQPNAQGLEDSLVLATPTSVEYRIDVSSVAGLRLVARTLEFLGSDGVPLFRMRAPEVVDADGVSRPIDLELVADGPSPACHADHDPRGPWGRALVMPGATSCRVRLRFDDAGLRYPLVVDPLWTTTGSMTTTRLEHAGVALTSGKVLIAGGASDGTSAELYDPASGTFAATGSMPTGGYAMRAVRLADGRVLAVAGTAAQLYDPTAGTWTATPAPPASFTRCAIARLTSGKVLVANQTNAALYDPTPGTWADIGPTPTSHSQATANELPNGKVLVVGGYSPNTSLYDPTAGTWSSGGTLNQQRVTHAALVLPSGQLMVIGGQKCGGCAFTNTAELYDASANTWSYTGAMAEVRMQVVAALLPTNKVLVPGGWTGGNLATKNVEIYDPATATWTSSSPMAVTRRLHSLTPLPNGKFLVAGGTDVNYVDLSSAEVFGLLGNGEACNAAVECTSDLCVDGVCCSSACAGTCEACSSAKKGGGQDGTCGPIAVGTDPDSECADEGAPSCGKTGVCDGAGACQLYASGSICFGPVCAGGVLTTGTCTGAGTCVQGPKNCAPYVCETGTTCGTSCATDADCELGAWCKTSDGSCQADQANGAACTSASQCKSGHCVDGVCCDSPCGGVCRACTASLKQSGAGDGVCGFAASGTDPHSTCPDDGAASCQRDGQCDGAGACSLYASGTVCGATACVGNVQSGFACDGTGTCNPASAVDCGNYLCVSDQCATTCTTDSDCIDAAWCDSGTCVAKGKNGATCQSALECVSGSCADGVCCDNECSGQCEACDVSGAEGTCVPVSGSPRNGRPDCDAAPAGEPCAARACDGITRDSCKGWAGATVECRAAGCSDGVATKAASCDGKGACPAAKVQECEPYGCGGELCKTACTTDADCATGALCDTATHQCARADVCLDEQTVKRADGTQAECLPYHCSAGACRKTCTSVADCVAPYVCDSESRCSLQSTSDQGAESGGCGCRAGRRAPGSGSAWGMLLALGLLARRRRSQRNS